MKWLKSILLITFILVPLVGCSGDSNEEGNNITLGTEKNKDNSSYDSNEVLSLGETGTMTTVLGEYEVTAHSVEIHEKFGDAKLNRDMFVIIDISIKNIGEDTLNGSDITKAVIFDDRGLRANALIHHDFVELITGDIEPGETESGQLLFDSNSSDSFELLFGYGRRLTSNEVRWSFTADDTKH